MASDPSARRSAAPVPAPRSISSLIQERPVRQVKELVLSERAIHVHERGLLREREFSVPLDHLPDDPVRLHAAPRSLWVFAVLASLYSLVIGPLAGPLGLSVPLVLSIGSGVVALAIWVSVFLVRTTRVILPTGYRPRLALFGESPSPEAVDEFLDAAYRQREELFRGRQQGAWPAAGPGVAPDGEASGRSTVVDELERLTWLHDQGWLSDEEFLVLKDRLVAETEGGAPGSADPVN